MDKQTLVKIERLRELLAEAHLYAQDIENELCDNEQYSEDLHALEQSVYEALQGANDFTL